MSQPSHRRPKRVTALLPGAAFLFLVLLASVILWNGTGLLQAAERSTQSYLRDVTNSSAQTVNTRCV